MKKIPYGLSEFKEIKLDNFYYIDKTEYIPMLENLPRYLFFIRPRRFGKSLFLSMLHYYYDERYKEQFKDIFQDTWVLENRTDEASSYKILRFDFSVIDSRKYQKDFDIYLELVLNKFIRKYELNIELNSFGAINKLNELFIKLQLQDMRIYCLIDEYDNFANELLSKQKEEYRRLVSEQESMFKQFFKILKSATGMEGGPLKKMFITGVSPMTMFDVTSGFNIGMFVSTNARLNSMLGITRQELEDLFAYYGLEPDFEVLDKWYNNYRFSSKTEDRVYNSDMVMYYVSKILQTGEPPEEMADLNIRTDYGKLKWLVYTDKKLNGNFGLLEKVVRGEVVVADKIEDAFSAFDLIRQSNFKSLLYYLGLLTIKDSGLGIELQLPNETIRKILCEYIERILEGEKLFEIDMSVFQEKLREFALTGDLSVFKYLGEVLDKSTGIRDYIHKETAVKMLYLVYLNLSNYYGVISEDELNKGYADILVYPRNEYVKYFALIEIKYISRSKPKPEDTGTTSSQISDTQNSRPDTQDIKSMIEKAKEQLEQYEQDELLKNWLKDGRKLKKIVMVFYGWEMLYCGEV